MGSHLQKFHKWILVFVVVTVVFAVLLFFTGHTLAGPLASHTFQLSGKVSDQSDNPIAGATVEVLTASTSMVVASDTTDTNGNYSISIVGGTYDVRVTPPAGSNLQMSQILGIALTGPNIIDIILVPIGPNIIVSGRVLDGAGSPVPNQVIQLFPSVGGTFFMRTTQSDGTYSFEIPAGEYEIQMRNISQTVISVPRYDLNTLTDHYLSLTADTILDITLPLKRVDVRVQDAQGNPVPGVELQAPNPQPTNYELEIAGVPAFGRSVYHSGYFPITDANGNATMWLFPTPGSSGYTISAVPPASSPFTAAIVSDVIVQDDIALTMTLESPITLSGRVLDGAGSPVPNQVIQLFPSVGGTFFMRTTQSDGTYSFEIPAGEYEIQMRNISQTVISVPRYDLNTLTDHYLSLTADTILDITLPLKRVDVRVQDAQGNPVPGVELQAPNPQPTNYELEIAGVPAFGRSVYHSGYFPITDANGNATMWLFPTPGSSGYTISAVPPASSPFTVFTVSNVQVTSDKVEVIVLQFIHDRPVTVASIDPEPDAEGIHSGPVTVILSATAFTGFSIESTFYSVNGGPEQIYTEPFVISDDGVHVIEYWSVDNAGVFEAPKTLTIEIQSNQPPTVNAGGPYIVDEGGSVVVTAVGSDPDGDPLTYAWDLNNDGVFDTLGGSVTFSAANLDGPGTHIITVRVTDPGGLSATDTATVEVVNFAPTADFANITGDLNIGGTATLAFSNQFDPGAADVAAGFVYSYDCTGDGVFDVTDITDASYDCIYAAAGTFNAIGRIKDKDGGFTDYQAVVFVNAPPVLTVNQPSVEVNEGQVAGNSGGVSDPDGDMVTLNVSLGTITNNGDGTWSWNFPTVDGPADSQTVTINASDGRGGTAQLTFSLVVYNVAPTVNAGADAAIFSGETFTVNATFTDPGILDTHTATIDFGTGSGPQPAAVAQGAGSGSLTGSQTYFVPNSYTVTVCVTDSDGGTGCDSLAVQVSALQVLIDIKPGSDPNSINLGSRGVVPVAILSSPTFDATTVDPTTVRLADAAVRVRGNGQPQASVQDMNHDGLPDLVVQVDTEALAIAEGDVQAILTGRTYAGVYITGVDSVWIVP